MAELFVGLFHPSAPFHRSPGEGAQAPVSTESVPTTLSAEETALHEALLTALGDVSPERIAWVRAQVRQIGMQASRAGLALRQLPILHTGVLPPLHGRVPRGVGRTGSAFAIATAGGAMDRSESLRLESALRSVLERMGAQDCPAIVLGRLEALAADDVHPVDGERLGFHLALASPADPSALLFLPRRQAPTPGVPVAQADLVHRARPAPTPVGRHPWREGVPLRPVDLSWIPEGMSDETAYARSRVTAPRDEFVMTALDAPALPLPVVRGSTYGLLTVDGFVNHLGRRFGLSPTLYTPGRDLALALPGAGAGGENAVAQQVALRLGVHVRALVGSLEEGEWALFHPGGRAKPFMQVDTARRLRAPGEAQRVRLHWPALEARGEADLTTPAAAASGRRVADILAAPGAFAVLAHAEDLEGPGRAQLVEAIRSAPHFTPGQLIMVIPWPSPAESLAPGMQGLSDALGSPAVLASDRIWSQHGRGILTDPVTVYRVEGERSSRLAVQANGDVRVRFSTATLWLNFGDEGRAREFFLQRRATRPDSPLVAIAAEVPLAFAQAVAATAVPTLLGRDHPTEPVAGDAVRAPDQFGLRPAQITAFAKAVLPGSGRYVFGTAPAPEGLASRMPDFGEPVELRSNSPRGGLYRDAQGRLNEVVLYKHREQALGHRLVDQLFFDLGVSRRRSVLEEHGRLSAVITPVPEASRMRLNEQELTADRAADVFRGFAAVLLAKHWGVPRDMRLNEQGGFERSDNGSALLWRAREKRKDAGGLTDLSEALNFFDYPANKSYSPFAHAAGYGSVYDIPDLERQIEDIIDLHRRHGGWDNYVEAVVPELQGAEREAIVSMLEERLRGLEQLLAGRRAGMAIEALPAFQQTRPAASEAPRGAGSSQVKAGEATASPPATWLDRRATAIFVPGRPLPESLNGIALARWTDAPQSDEAWIDVPGQVPELDQGQPLVGGDGRWVRTSVVIVEREERRFWVVERRGDGPNGLVQTFGHARVSPQLPIQATAIRHAYETLGLQVRLVNRIADVRTGGSLIRYYLAVRVGGTLADMNDQVRSVKLVPASAMWNLLNAKRERSVFTRAERLCR